MILQRFLRITRVLVSVPILTNVQKTSGESLGLTIYSSWNLVEGRRRKRRRSRPRAQHKNVRNPCVGFQKLSGYLRTLNVISTIFQIVHLSRILVNHSVHGRWALLYIMASTVHGCSGILRSRYRLRSTRWSAAEALVPRVKP